MSTFPGSPRLLKGAIIGLDPGKPLASVIVLQYNPDTMTRRVEARSTGGGGNVSGMRVINLLAWYAELLHRAERVCEAES